ncbi:MAG: DNA polymerase III subunit alpha, partial [Nitrospirae bacterium]|nr:DNA polymerase III subunit alpha [Nitrospirota bacterium]
MHHSDFVHLHVHTKYSLLDGANTIEDLVETADRFKMPAIAITDHGNMFGAVEFYEKAVKGGIKPIIGCEAYLAPASRLDKANHYGIRNASFHIVLLAADTLGYKNLIKLISAAHLEGFYYRPRLDKELLRKYHEGLIGLSACLKGEIPFRLAEGNFPAAEKAAIEYCEIFGKGNFYIELQENKLDIQRKVNRDLLTLAKKLNLPIVATADAHYLRREDAKAHDVLMCIQTGKMVQDEQRMRFSTDEFYIKSPEEMAHDFSELPEALKNTRVIAERCNVDLQLGKTHLPHYDVPEGHTRESFLTELARKGLAERLQAATVLKVSKERYEERLKEELRIISDMGYAGYFLIVWDFIHFARTNGIPVGPGRGSAAGSLVAYSLRITDLDPMTYDLLFERFLNPERISLPDIDIDFCMDNRDRVIEYVNQKYGADHVAQIITFGTMAARGVIRDVGRTLDIPYAEVDRVAKLIPNSLNMTLDEALRVEPKLKELMNSQSKIQQLIDYARSLEGLTRHASTHAAGVVISRDPITDHVPLYRGAHGEVVTQYSMEGVEKIGLVKFDFLGLRNLTVIARAVKLINQRAITGADAGTGDPKPFRIEEIPLDDPESYTLLGSGNTSGVFQLESSGMRDIMVKMKPDCFEDVIALLALYRPGPLGSGMVDDYIKRRRGGTKITYEVPQLEPILKETYGVILYQEQVMKIANVLAGFSLGEADILRRAMGKKKPEEMEKLKHHFIEGARNRKINEKKAEKIFGLMEYFAGYGFNKSHSATYALICYQTAYLKTHYPEEYMTAMLTSEMDNMDKVVGHIRECQEMGIPILPPDVNASESDFTVSPQNSGMAIRFGLAAVKNVGTAAIESIIANRNEGGPFTSVFDLCRRVDLRKVNRKTVEFLIRSGAVDSLHANRAQLLEGLDLIMDYGASLQKEKHQVSLFEMGMSEGNAMTPKLPDIPDWDENVKLKYEKESIGFYITGHPLARYERDIRFLSPITTEKIRNLADGQETKLCGVLSNLKVTTTKK